MPLGSFAALVLPLLALEEREIDAPDEDRSAPFHSPRRIDRVAPHDVPTRVIVVRLNCPRTRTALRFQRFPWWRVEFTLQGKIGEALLRNVGVFVPLIWAEGIECPDAHDADDSTEDVRLFQV